MDARDSGKLGVPRPEAETTQAPAQDQRTSTAGTAPKPRRFMRNALPFAADGPSPRMQNRPSPHPRARAGAGARTLCTSQTQTPHYSLLAPRIAHRRRRRNQTRRSPQHPHSPRAATPPETIPLEACAMRHAPSLADGPSPIIKSRPSPNPRARAGAGARTFCTSQAQNPASLPPRAAHRPPPPPPEPDAPLPATPAQPA